MQGAEFVLLYSAECRFWSRPRIDRCCSNSTELATSRIHFRNNWCKDQTIVECTLLCYMKTKKRAVNWINPTKGGSFKTIFGFKVSLWLGWWMMNFKFPPTNPLLLSPILVIEIDVWLISLLSWRWYVAQFCQTTPSLCLNNLPILLFKISSSFRLRPKCHSCCEVSLENISLLA